MVLPGAEARIDGLRLLAEGGVDRRGRHRVMAVRAWLVDPDAEVGEPGEPSGAGESGEDGPGTPARADAAGASQMPDSVIPGGGVEADRAATVDADGRGRS